MYSKSRGPTDFVRIEVSSELNQAIRELLKRPALERKRVEVFLSGWDEQTLQQTYFLKGSASCVQNFDDSLDFAIRMTYRISLRSSSLWEPRHPLLKVLVSFFFISACLRVTVDSPCNELEINWLVFNHTLMNSEDIKRWLGFVALLLKITRRILFKKRHNEFYFLVHGTQRKALPMKRELSFVFLKGVVMILPQVHLRKPCYDFTFL